MHQNDHEDVLIVIAVVVVMRVIVFFMKSNWDRAGNQNRHLTSCIQII